MGNPAIQASSVVSISSRAAYRPDFRGLASGQVKAAREKLRLDHDGFARYLGSLLGWTVMPGTVARWEEGAIPPGDVLLAAALASPSRFPRGIRRQGNYQSQEGQMTMTDNSAITAAENPNPCPPWCTGEHGGDDTHSGHITEISLSLAEPCETASGMRPDFIGVRLWHQKAEMSRPAVGVQHGDDYLPDMTPAEAVALAAALVQAAWRAEPGAVEAIPAQDAPRHDPGSCPPWCAYGLHGPYDDVHFGDGNAVAPASATHLCSYTTGPGAVEECGEDICAQLVLSEDGCTLVELHHGDNC